MVLPTVALRMFGTVCVLTALVLAGGAMAKPGDRSPIAGEIQLVSASAGDTPTVAVSPVAPSATTSSSTDCSRKVKVVYAGYGEAARASCAAGTAVSKAD